MASYDEDNEIVWVHDMATSQVAPRLSPKDNRVSSVAKQLSLLPICQITLAFYRRYGEVFHLRDQLCLEDFERAHRRGFGGPSEGLRSKEKEKEKEQDLGAGKEKFGSDAKRLASTHARDFDEQEYAYEPKQTLEANRCFLIEIGVPAHRMETALQRLMREVLFPCDIEEWKREARDERAA